MQKQDLNRAKSTKPAPKSNSPPTATNSPALSVKDIAARVKPSLVTITFTGRDGSVDGTGSGFVVAPDGLIATSLHVISHTRGRHSWRADAPEAVSCPRPAFFVFY